MTGMAKEIFNQHPSHQAAYYSIMSGIYACLASVLGKLSTDPRTFTYFQKTFIILSGGSAKSVDFDDAITPKVASVIRIGLFATMFLVNGLMWTNYTKALDSSINSIRVVVLNNAVNMLATVSQLTCFRSAPLCENLNPHFIIFIMFLLIFIDKSNFTSATFCFPSVF